MRAPREHATEDGTQWQRDKVEPPERLEEGTVVGQVLHHLAIFDTGFLLHILHDQ